MLDEDGTQDISCFNRTKIDFDAWSWVGEEETDAFINRIVTRAFETTLLDGDHHPRVSIALIDGRAALEFSWSAFGDFVVYTDLPSIVWGTDDMPKSDRDKIASALEAAAKMIRENDPPED